jgi:hypothetical protein
MLVGAFGFSGRMADGEERGEHQARKNSNLHWIPLAVVPFMPMIPFGGIREVEKHLRPNRETRPRGALDSAISSYV